MYNHNYQIYKVGKKPMYLFLSLFIEEIQYQDTTGDMEEMEENGINLIKHLNSSIKRKS
jgi:hypothetical protein